jgi:hypothetical protein
VSELRHKAIVGVSKARGYEKEFYIKETAFILTISDLVHTDSCDIIQLQGASTGRMKTVGLNTHCYSP